MHFHSLNKKTTSDALRIQNLPRIRVRLFSIQQFEFLRKYFNDLNKNDFEKCIESKKWLLDSGDWNLCCIQNGSKLIFDGLKY